MILTIVFTVDALADSLFHAPSAQSEQTPDLLEGVELWNERALELSVKHRRNPLRVARGLAVLHLAIHRSVAFAAAQSGDELVQKVAAGAAAGPVLDYLFPLEAPGRFEAMAWATYATAARESDTDPELLRAAWSAGLSAARHAISYAQRDNSDLTWDPMQRPVPAPGIWRAAPPLNAYDPLEPLAATWATWVLKSSGEIQPPPPIAYDTPEYWRETEEVLAVSRVLTPQQKRIAEEWNLDQGSVTPAGVWNLKARALLRAGNLDTQQAARVLALLNLAMADASIVSWKTKFTHWTQRPVTAIRDRFDTEWLPHLLTPAFPSYLSTHATVSGAAAAVVSAFFPEAAESLQAAAEEAAMSRLYGGIHFRSDNDEGLNLGRRISQVILERAYTGNPGSPLTDEFVLPLLQTNGN
ncbi:MAG: vanadium-dependent haloperoxidase [Gammaproteobacteria bacterium]|nr:vanadium-dependent haloperoxidase [Gammaproteobacteria bacterium]